MFNLGDRPHVSGGSEIIIGVGQVFQHQRCIGVEAVHLVQQCDIIQPAEPQADFREVDGQLLCQGDVFGVTTFDVRSEAFKAIAQETAVVII